MPKQLRIKNLPVRNRPKDPKQWELDLHVENQTFEGDIGMGVLSDGTPYLTQRALGDLCGLRNKYIGQISSEWQSLEPPKEVKRLKELLYEQGVTIPDMPHFEV